MFDKTPEYYDAIYSFKDYPEESRKVHDHIQSRRPGAVTLLDVACGTGKHIESLKTHYRCEGLDLDEGLLDVARRRNPEVAFHVGDMAEFDLGTTFDAVTCLFSAIGYALTDERLDAAIAAMARHLEPGGVLVVEPWLSPDTWDPAFSLSANVVDEPELKIMRINRSRREGDVAVLQFDYLIATPDETLNLTEEHRATLWSDDRYAEAFEKADLTVEHDDEGLMGRGLFIGSKA